tara:strand:+ start:249 stop:389 length:141 start_codon:yes stop_codon:yes gene_type:complete
MVLQRGTKNGPDGFEVKFLIFLPQYGNCYSLVNADLLETIVQKWRP